MKTTFHNANSVFCYFYNRINNEEKLYENGTKKIYNIGFFIENPTDNSIAIPFRKWNPRYAQREFDWYLSENRKVTEIKKFAPIWDRMHYGDDLVNSNYGHLWNQNNQLNNTILQLKQNKFTRQAWITLFDGKNKINYGKDTPCTLNIGFNTDDGKLNMTIIMRSNDLWYGFCNDQYCFSELQKIVAKELNIEIGWYYHFASDLHIYKQHLDLS